MNNMEKNQVQIGIRLVSILNYLFAFIMVIMGFILIFYSQKLVDFVVFVFGSWSIREQKHYILMGIIFICLSLFYFVMAYSLSRHKEWARVTSIITSTIMICTIFFGYFYLDDGVIE